MSTAPDVRFSDDPNRCEHTHDFAQQFEPVRCDLTKGHHGQHEGVNLADVAQGKLTWED